MWLYSLKHEKNWYLTIIYYGIKMKSYEKFYRMKKDVENETKKMDLFLKMNQNK